MEDDVKISAEDQERINSMVQNYRHQLENLYRMAYIQGHIDQANDTRAILAKT